MCFWSWSDTLSCDAYTHTGIRSAPADSHGDLRFLGPVQLYFDVELAMWSFNSLVRAWEPVLEPWKLIINGDMNSGQSVSTDAPCHHLAFHDLQRLAELLGKCDTSSHLQSVPGPC